VIEIRHLAVDEIKAARNDDEDDELR